MSRFAALRTRSGLAGYDVARWTGWVPRLERVHAAGGMNSLLQRVPAGAHGSNETEVSSSPAHVLLFWVEGVGSLDYRIVGQPLRRTAQPWSGVFLPAGVDSWWASTPQAADHVFHLHLDGGFVARVAEEDGWPSVVLEPRSALEDPIVSGLASMAYDMLGGPDPPARMLWDSLAGSLALRLLRLEREERPRPRTGGLTPLRLRRVAQYVEAQLAQDIALAELAAVADLSPFHFARAFKQSTGQAPHAWLTTRRIERAQELMLAHPAMPLIDVALAVGYASQTAFGAAFRRVVGAPPAEWRRERAR